MKCLKAIAFAVVLAGSVSGVGSAKAGELTGSQSDSCSALLCLAAIGSAPSECTAPLRKYYSLDASSMSKLRKKRRDFLNRCPSSQPDLVNSLVRGECNPTYQACTPAGGGGDTPAPAQEAKAE